MRNPIKTSPFITDVILTTITSVLTIGSLIFATRLLADGLGPEKFGAYSLVRRVLSTIEPFSTLCMSVALTRYVAISRDECSRQSYFLSGLILVLAPCSVIISAGLLLEDHLTFLVFHSAEYESLFYNMLFLIAGYSFYIALYSYYRGLGRMLIANIWQLNVMAIAPVLIAVFFARSSKLDLIVLLTGMCFFSAVIPLISSAGKAIRQIKKLSLLKAHLKELLNYSLPRILSQFAFAALLMIGPFVAPYIGGMKEAGYLFASQSLLRVVEGGIEGFSRVALPKIAQIFSEGKHEFLKDRVSDLIAFIFHVGTFITLHLFLWSDQVILVWLGSQYAGVIPVMKITALAIMPFIAYSMLRSIIDAIEEKAVNTFNLFTSFLVSLLLSLLFAKAGLGINGLALGMIAGFWILGILTVNYLFRKFKIGTRIFHFSKIIALNTVIIAAAAIAKYCLEANFTGILLGSAAFMVESIFFLVYGIILWKLSIGWTTELLKRIY